jgi:hypothetical protein
VIAHGIAIPKVVVDLAFRTHVEELDIRAGDVDSVEKPNLQLPPQPLKALPT